MVIDHIGIAVPALIEGIRQWTHIFGYRQMTDIVTNTRQKVRVVFMQKENSVTVKLMEPTDATSPVYILAAKGGGFHHLCFKCDDVVAETSRLESLVMRVLELPEPGEAFENNRISFVYGHDLGLSIELIDTDLKARRLDMPNGSF